MADGNLPSHARIRHGDAWLAVGSSLVALGACAWCFGQGIFVLVQNLLYIPIVFACNRFGNRGLAGAILLSFTYLGLAAAFRPAPPTLAMAAARALLFIAMGVIVARMAERQRRTEVALVQSRNGLERRVSEQTAELRRRIIQAEGYLETTQTIMVALDANGRIALLNRRGRELLGDPDGRLVGRNWFESCLPQPEGMERVYPVFQRIMAGELAAVEYFENQVIRGDGARRLMRWHNAPLRDEAGRIAGALSSGEDITEQRQMAEFRELGRELLGLFNDGPENGQQELIRKMLRTLNGRAGLDAAGIRLREEIPGTGEDYPYYASDGFSADFLRAEDSLLARGPDGGICRNGDGGVSLECTCGLVISGQTDPANPLFTPGGSCWTNDSFPLLELPASRDPRLHPRNNCIHAGYASVALVPIRHAGRTFGLIHLASRSKGWFSSAAIEAMEVIAASLGGAMAHLEAEAELRRHRRLMDDMARITKVGGWEYDTASRRIYWSDEVYRIYGLNPGEHDPSDVPGSVGFYSPEDQATIDATFRKCTADGEPYDLELRFRNAVGEWLWIRTMGQAEFRAGKVARVFGNIMDITDRKRMESELVQMKKNESLGRMAGAIAHNYNNLMAVVLGNLEMAAANAAHPDRAAAMTEAAVMAARQAAETSHLMLAYIGQEVSERGPVDAAALCRELVASPDTRLPAGVRLETVLSPGTPRALGNAHQIRQAVANVLQNAGESLGEDGGEIKLAIAGISAREIPADGIVPAGWRPGTDNYVCVAVADTGCGIAPDTREMLFDPFFSTKFTGRGLGLSVVLGMVKSHGGALTVESRPGGGTVVRMFFPAAAGQPPQSSSAPPLPGAVGADPGLTLVVDDEPMLRIMAQHMLRSLGYEAEVAPCGAAAVELARQRADALRCVVCDLTMPGMNGWEVLAAMRAIRPDLPFILCSGYDEPSVMAEAREQKPQAFLAKPYGLDALAAAMAMAVSREPSRTDRNLIISN